LGLVQRREYTDNDGLLQWLVSAFRREVFYFPHDAPAVDDLAEHYVFLVKVGRRNRCDEELRAIGA